MGERVPLSNQEVLAEQDLLGIGLPMEYGGGGYFPVEVLLAQEAVGRVCRIRLTSSPVRRWDRLA